MTRDTLAEKIRTHVERLCADGDRDPGTARNRAATAYVLEAMREAGMRTEELPFEVPEWRYRHAHVRVHDVAVDAHPGPFSAAFDGEGELTVVEQPEQLDGLDARRKVLLLRGDIAHVQFTPRDYPFYRDAGHAAILDALEAARPAVVLAATGKNPSMTGAMSPFPLIEEVRFRIPTAYMTAEDGIALATHAGEPTRVRIDSGVRPSTGVQPVGRLEDTWPQRVIVAAHIDSKPGTPGAIDNAAGVAVLLAVAELLTDVELSHAIEFVPFNGEDHVLAPGELAYLAAHGDFADIRLMINIDAAGLPGAPSAYSLYGVDERTAALAEDIAAGNDAVAEGPQWPASDHMIFAMRNVAAMAVTSADFMTASGEYSHTAADTPDILDYDLLAATARFIAALIAEL